MINPRPVWRAATSSARECTEIYAGRFGAARFRAPTLAFATANPIRSRTAARKQKSNGKSSTRARTRDTFVAAQRHADANDKKHKGKKEMTISQQPAIMKEPAGELQLLYTNQTVISTAVCSCRLRAELRLSASPRAPDIPRVPLVPLFGHEALRRRLSESASKSALPASLLIEGRRGIGKQRLALWLGQLLLCTGEGERPCGKCVNCRYSTELVHPDLRWFFPRPREANADPAAQAILEDQAEAVSARVADFGLYAPPSGSDAIFVATVRALVQFAAYSPSVAKRKVIVVGDAERMVPQEGADQAANAFLKLLEEPPADTTIILTSSEPGSLLPTIRSRVVSLRVAPLPNTAIAAFLHDAHVQKALGDLDLPDSESERIALAAGAPGTLLGVTASGEAMKLAKTILAATTGARADRIRAAFALSSAGARGGFSELLDALTVALHGRIREASISGNAHAGEAASRAIDLVEGAKLRASGNVNPQLIASAMIRAMSEL